jgi:hypothetical protein
MPSPLEPSPPPPPRFRALREFVESLRDLSAIGKPCTCGNPKKIGPCPRHGKLT